MRAILLCAGFGTRMYPLTRDVAKPLLPVAGRPVLDYLMDQIVAFEGLEAIHVVVNGRFFHQFEVWRRGWRDALAGRGLRLALHNDGAMDNEHRLGAIGDLALVLRQAGVPETALVAAGDNIFRFSLASLWLRLQTEQANLVVALPEEDLARRQRTGVLELAPDDRVLRFHEKPHCPPSTWTCPPLYGFVASALRRTFDFLADPGAGDAPGHFVDHLLRQEPVYAWKADGARFDIGSMASYREADRVLGQEAVIPF